MKKKMIISLVAFSAAVVLLVLFTLAAIEEMTPQKSLAQIEHTKNVLFLLLALVPLAALALAVFFIVRFVTPVETLVKGARRLKGGDVAHRIAGLQGEFGELANSLNSIADSLGKDNLKMQWAEQLVVLGEMAGGLVHEIKNPLAGIKASLDFLSCDSALSCEHRMILLQGNEQIKRIEGLLKSILNFARPPKPQFMPVNVNEVLAATMDLVQRHPLLSPTVARSITLIRDFINVRPVMADPQQLQQVFLNILLNSADAMPLGGIIRVSTDIEESTGSLHITFTDSGTGINGEILDRIFQPFFTTKPHGTGLGLAITKGLIEQHGGSVRVENNNGGVGASFVVILPLRECNPHSGHHELRLEARNSIQGNEMDWAAAS